MDTENRFWAKVNKLGENECWPWMASKSQRGYGVFGFRGTIWKAHRVAYTMAIGEIPSGLLVCHKCDNPSCCNPAHLWAGTSSDNNRDRSIKGRNNHPKGDNHPLRKNPKLAARGDRNGARLYPDRLARGDRHGSRLHPERLKRGSNHHSAKVSEGDVRQMRLIHSMGNATYTSIAKKFGLSRPTTAKIVKRLLWTHVA